MSRIRHKMRASGGGLSSEPKWNAGGEQNAAKEAEEKKKGGRVKKHHTHAEGDHAKHRADKRARGGHVHHHAKHEHEERKHGGHVKHHHHKGEEEKERKHGGVVGHHDGDHVHKHVKQHSMMHKERARGGRIGANHVPLSTAARVKHITPGETPEEGMDDEAKSTKTIKG